MAPIALANKEMNSDHISTALTPKSALRLDEDSNSFNWTPKDVKTLALKYAAGGNFAFRSSNSIHDRVLFADGRVWLTGQSLKDAAKKKPTYIVEHDEPLMRTVYEDIWNKATVI